MPASWRTLNEIPGACVIRIDEAVECARLLVGGYLLLAPLGTPAIGRYRVHGQEVAARAGRTQLREPGDVHLTLDRRSGTLRALWLPAGHVEAVARELGWHAAPHWRNAAVDDEALFAAQLRLHADLEGEGRVVPASALTPLTPGSIRITPSRSPMITTRRSARARRHGGERGAGVRHGVSSGATRGANVILSFPWRTAVG